MKIFLSSKSNFCFGVKRAIDLIEKNLKKNFSLYTLGPIIHNPQEVKRLEKMGLKVVEKVEEIKNGKLVVSCYGLSPEIIKEVKKRKISLIDATCPYVKNLREKAKNLNIEGYQVIIIGDRGHQEVETLQDVIGRRGIVVSEEKELKNLKIEKKVGVVAQTTQNFSNFKKIVSNLLKKTKELKIYNTICSATFERQREAKILAKKVDLMLIVGGKNSANTNRLFHISKGIVETYHIEEISQIKKSWFKNKEKIGIISGASTPSWIIEEILQNFFLKNFCDVKIEVRNG
jgi:4-hydroxy-3-methylbut-2-enyl diphosphate reductase